MKKFFSILFYTAIASILSQCAMDIHEMEDIPGQRNIVIPDSIRPGAKGTLAAELYWLDNADRSQAVNFITITVSDSIGIVKTDSFSTKAEMASWSLAVPTGDYDMLVTANLTMEKGFSIESTPKSEADQESTGTTLVDADCTYSPSSAEKYTWFGVTRAAVTAGEHTVARVNLQRMFASVEVTMINVPQDAGMTVKVVNTAESINLTRPMTKAASDTTALWGLVSDKMKTVTIKSDKRSDIDSTVTCSGLIYPTARNEKNARIVVSLTLADNTPVTAPEWAFDTTFVAGQAYDITLDYNTLMPPEIIIKQDGVSIKGAVKEGTSVDFSTERTHPLGWAYSYQGYDDPTSKEETLTYTTINREQTASLGGLQPGYYVARLTYGKDSGEQHYTYRIFGVTKIIVDPDDTAYSQSLAE